MRSPTSALAHVRWVCGGSGAGKTTVTRLLAERQGVRVYSTDAAIAGHRTASGPPRRPC